MTDISEILVRALKDVEDAKFPDSLKETALREAIRLRSEEAGFGVSPQVGHSTTAARQQEPAGAADLLGKIASRLGVERGPLEDIFDEQDGSIGLIVAPRRLDGAVASGTKQIALLVAAARQGAQLEDWTSVNEIRRWCEEYKRYDSTNFSKTIGSMDNVFGMRGQKQQRQLKMSRPAWDEAAELVRELAGGE